MNFAWVSDTDHLCGSQWPQLTSARRGSLRQTAAARRGPEGAARTGTMKGGGRGCKRPRKAGTRRAPALRPRRINSRMVHRSTPARAQRTLPLMLSGSDRMQTESRDIPDIANGLASPNASRLVCLGRSPGSRVEFPVGRTFPRLPAQWCIAVAVSLTVAWAAPDWRSCPERAPASRFTPGPLRTLGHLRRGVVYVAPPPTRNRAAGRLPLRRSMVSVPTTLNVCGRLAWISDFARSLHS